MGTSLRGGTATQELYPRRQGGLLIMTRHALALAAFLLLGVGVHAQGSNMEPIYAYDQSDWFNSTTTAFTISYEIRGYTYCPSGCPANVYHYGVITLQVGGDNESENFYGAKV